MHAIHTINEATSSLNKPIKKESIMLHAIALIAACQQYIVRECSARDMGLKPCAKTAVYAILITADGTEYFGANWMTNCDITVCPREAGELYEKCLIACGQPWHAECAALAELEGFEDDATAAVVFITGHTVCCDNCQKEMAKAGVKYAASLDSGKEYHF